MVNSEWFKTYRIWATNKVTKVRQKLTIYWITDWDEVLEVLQRRNINADTYDIKIKRRYGIGEECKGRLAQMDKIKQEMMGGISE